MRDLNDYDIIFCDIDDTLIYGPWTDIMRYTWDVLHSNIISDWLMYLQDRFNIFKVNQKLRFMLMNCYRPIVFLTARKDHPATLKVINKILNNPDNIRVISLATNNPEDDKINKIFEFMDEDDSLERICIFDDNDKVRINAHQFDFDAFNMQDVLHEGWIV